MIRTPARHAFGLSRIARAVTNQGGVMTSQHFQHCPNCGRVKYCFESCACYGSRLGTARQDAGRWTDLAIVLAGLVVIALVFW